jgi:hypothetical protein
LFCKCCGMQLRASPAGRVYKEDGNQLSLFFLK